MTEPEKMPLPTISKDRFESAIKSIEDGIYTCSKLRNRYELDLGQEIDLTTFEKSLKK